MHTLKKFADECWLEIQGKREHKPDYTVRCEVNNKILAVSYANYFAVNSELF